MKKILFAILTLTIISCNQDKDTYILKGNAFGFEDNTQVFVHNLDANNNPEIIDTLIIINEKFEGKYPKLSMAELHYLKVGTTGLNVIYFAESEDLKANIYADSLSSSKVVGGNQNEIYYSYLDQLKSFSMRKGAMREAFQKAQSEQNTEELAALRTQNFTLVNEEKEYKKSFLADNVNSIFGIMLLEESFNRKEVTATEANELIATLSPKLSNNAIVDKLKTTIKNAERASIGNVAPSFKAPNPKGELLSLEDAMGKYTIIDFWASWCKPCRMENPNVVNVYNKYHDKGLNIISVSLDRQGQKDRWLKAIEDDQMDWYHVSNLQFWNDPIAREYNVRSIPATFLIDENGTIIDKNLRGRVLETKIASLLD